MCLTPRQQDLPTSWTREDADVGDESSGRAAGNCDDEVTTLTGEFFEVYKQKTHFSV